MCLCVCVCVCVCVREDDDDGSARVIKRRLRMNIDVFIVDLVRKICSFIRYYDDHYYNYHIIILFDFLFVCDLVAVVLLVFPCLFGF